MTADFFERMRHLEDAIGAGNLRAEVTVDQVYAKYQELRDDLVLHGGGQHHYTRDALFDQIGDIMRGLADTLLTPSGSDIKRGMADAAETIAAGVYEKAPFEFGDLKGSPHPTAADNGAVYYDRPPAVPRLSEDELAAKGDLRRLGFGNRRSVTPDVAAALGVGR